MNGRKRITIIIIIFLLAVAASATAMGNRDAGQPEPVVVKGEAAAEKSGEPENGSYYPPEGWVTDIREAYRLAQTGNKKILLNFTGSDWCVWCKKLSKEVFNTPEFKNYADENLVMLFLDFPNGIELSAKQIQHNQLISQMLGVQGYPSIWLLDSDLSPVMVTGYREGGADEYIRHLSDDRPDVPENEREGFRLSFTEAIETNLGPLN